MDIDLGPGQVFNLMEFVQRFYKMNKKWISSTDR